MYVDEYENRGYPIKGFILNMIVILLTFFALAFFIAKFTNLSKDNNEYVNIFLDNLYYLKEKTVNYYSDSNSPNSINESSVLYLKDMNEIIDLNELYDINLEKSFVSITKLDRGYLLKIYFDNDYTNDYYLFHLDSYSYCDTYLCFKNVTSNTINNGVKTLVPFEQES